MDEQSPSAESYSPELTEKLRKAMAAEYSFLYDTESDGGEVAGTREAMEAFDRMLDTSPALIYAVSDARGDPIVSDREAAAFMFALQQVLPEGEVDDKQAPSHAPEGFVGIDEACGSLCLTDLERRAATEIALSPNEEIHFLFAEIAWEASAASNENLLKWIPGNEDWLDRVYADLDPDVHGGGIYHQVREARYMCLVDDLESLQAEICAYAALRELGHGIINLHALSQPTADRLLDTLSELDATRFSEYRDAAIDFVAHEINGQWEETTYVNPAALWGVHHQDEPAFVARSPRHA